MNKPVMNRRIAISDGVQPTLYFFTTPEIAEQLREFGRVEQVIQENEYCLSIDARYDSIEVKEWIENLNREGDDD